MFSAVEQFQTHPHSVLKIGFVLSPTYVTDKPLGLTWGHWVELKGYSKLLKGHTEVIQRSLKITQMSLKITQRSPELVQRSLNAKRKQNVPQCFVVSTTVALTCQDVLQKQHGLFFGVAVQ